MPAAPAIVWFRLDLRLADNPALSAATASKRPIVPVFLWAPEEERPWAPGAGSRWWLGRSLAALERELAARGSRLIVRRGPSLDALRSIAAETGADTVFWNRRYEPAMRERDENVERALASERLRVETFNSALAWEPGSVLNRSGKPFQVFSAFWRELEARGEPPAPEPAPATLPRSGKWPESLPLGELGLDNPGNGLAEAWRPGEAEAHGQLSRFLDEGLADYATARDFPSRPGTSRLSPHLHFGEIGPRQVWQAVRALRRRSPPSASAFLRQMAWREFGHHLLYHFPHTQESALYPLEGVEWHYARDAAPEWRAWKEGRTGYALVDAGMRQLRETGWMHNRVRLAAASFLVKDLMIHWLEGARWFWETLVDADLANNTLGWQWVAGCGADAAPFFRVFNPELQAKRFDPGGEYVARWAPEPVSPIVDHARMARLAREAAGRRTAIRGGRR